MSTATVYLHIGRHKSGTSSLQAFLHNNKAILLEREILYPSTGCKKGAIAHHHLAEVLTDKKSIESGQFNDIQRQLIQESDDCKVIIISSEAFQQISNLERVKLFFQPFAKLVVVAYLREYVDYLQTSYAQKVHFRGYKSSFEYYAQTQNVYGRVLNYRKFIHNWKSVADEVKVGLYQRDVLESQDVILDFFQRIFINTEDLKFTKNKANPSIGGNLLYFKLCLNYLGVNNGGKYYKVLGQIAEQRKRYQSGFYINDEVVKLLRIKFSVQNEYLEELFPNVVNYKFYSNKEVFPDRNKLIEDFGCFLSQDELRNIDEKSKKSLLDLSILDQWYTNISNQNPTIFSRLVFRVRRTLS